MNSAVGDALPLISVIIPTYNRGMSTVEAARSVDAQTYRNIQVVIVDDGSTNGADNLLREYIASTAQQKVPGRRHQLIVQKNEGPGGARNTGLRAVKGEYVAFLDSDDLWSPDKLDAQMDALRRFRGKAGACITDARCKDHRGMNVGSFRLFRKRYHDAVGMDSEALRDLAKAFCGFWISTLLAEVEIVRRIGGFNRELSFAEDRDFYFRLCLATPLLYVNRELVQVDRSRSVSGMSVRLWDDPEVRLRSQQKMYESWCRLGGSLPLAVRDEILDALRGIHSAWASWHLKGKRYDDARREVSRAVQYSISPKIMVKWALTWIAPWCAAWICGWPT